MSGDGDDHDHPISKEKSMKNSSMHNKMGYVSFDSEIGGKY